MLYNLCVIYFLCLSFFIGIFSGFLVDDIFTVTLFVLCCMCAWVVFWICTKNKIYKNVLLCSLFLLLGTVLADRSKFLHSQFLHLTKTYVFFEGVVSTEPKVTDKGMRVEIEVLKNGSSTLSRSEKILVSYDGYDSFMYGDIVKVNGVLEQPQKFETDGGREFNYSMYLAKDGIYAIIQKGKIEKITSGGGNFLLRYLYTWKRVFISKIEKVLSASDTALISGILLGAQDSIPQATKTDFQKSGLTHILVLSGYNITVVGESISRIANVWFSKFISLGFGGFSIILFALLSGGGAATIRSTVMALIAIFGKILGRDYDAFRVLILVAALMVAWNPHTLLYDPSFHLSFLATAGMILLSKRIEVRMVFIRFAALREIVATTLAVQIFVTPYFLWSMGSVSIISLVSNIFVLPVVPSVMFTGFITGVFGFISPYIAFIPGLISHLLLLYITSMAHFFASFSFAVWKL